MMDSLTLRPHLPCTRKTLAEKISGSERELSNWIEQGLTSTKHIIGHIGDGFYWSYDLTNSVKALKDDRF